MNAFEDRTLDELKNIAGQTPAYLYDARVLDQQIEMLRASLPPCIRVHYSLKANPMSALVSHVARSVDGLDVASLGELHIALASGMSADRLSFTGPGKRLDELVAAVATGIVVHAESSSELNRIAEAATKAGKSPVVSLRVNPDFKVRRTGMVMGGGAQAFGIDSDRIKDTTAYGRSLGLEIVGLHCYPGSQILSVETLASLHCATLDLLVKLAVDAGIHTPSLNIGGGFGIPYFPGETPLELRQLGELLEPSIRSANRLCNPSEIVVESGRYIAGPAGIYLVTIIEKKVSRDEVFLLADGGLNHHLAASGNLGQVIRKNFPLRSSRCTLASGTDTETVNVVGPLCTPLDTLATKTILPKLDAGELIAIGQSGAYGLSASPLFFLSHPRPAELLIH